VLAVGATLIIVSGEIDLSFAASASLAAVITVVLLIETDIHLYAAWLIAVTASVSVGILNAVILKFTRIPSLLSTIAMWLTLQGLSAVISKGETIWTSAYPKGFEFLGRYSLFGVVPIPVVTFTIITIAGAIFLERTRLGRYFYATGGNPNAATHAGIDIRQVKNLAFIIMGFLSGISGITMASLYASVTPTVGDGFLFPAVISVFLGAIFLKDGVPNVWGTAVAALLFATLSNGFVMIGLMYWWKLLAQGLIMMFAVITIVLTGKREIRLSL
jgi:ribose/xylose/arabinose/galactoside ABC-type transport system permease subunit